MSDNVNASTDTVIYLDGNEFGEILNTARLPLAKQDIDITTFGKRDMKCIAGIRSGALNVEGFRVGSADAYRTVINEAVGNTTTTHKLLYGPDGGAYGSECWLINSNQNSAEVGAPYNQAIHLTAVFNSTGGPRLGRILHSAEGSTAIVTANVQGVQTMTVANGDDGDYTVNGSAAFALGDANGDIQTAVRATGGNWANVVVGGTSTAPGGADLTGAGTASSNVDTSTFNHEPAHAFDNDPDTYFQPDDADEDPVYLAYDLGVGNEEAVNRYTIRSGGGGGSQIVAWVLEGSNDGSAWTPLDTRLNQFLDDVLATNTYNFSNVTAYQHYRLNITEVGSSGKGAVKEMELMTVVEGSAALTFTFPAGIDAGQGEVTGTGATMAITTPAVIGSTSEAVYNVVTATGNGTTHDNGAATSNGYTAHLHNFYVAGTTPNMVVKVQHSTNGSDWVDLITFTAITGGKTVQRVENKTATVNRYTRVIRTVTGTNPKFVFSVGFSRFGNITFTD